MPKFLSNINLETANDVQFKTTAGAAAGKIEQNGNDLVLSNAVGDVLIGDGNADVYIGDGTNNVDILFEQSGSIKAEDGSSGVTLTLGSSDTTLVFGGQTNLADVVSAMSATGVNTVDIGTNAKPFKNIYAAHHVGGSSINYATSRGWVEDAVPLSSTQGGFYGGNFIRNGDADENAVVRGQDPFNNKALLWKCILHDTDDDADGGWNKNITIPANNNIGYLSYVYFMADFTPDSNTAGSRDGTVYLGCGQTAGQTINVSDDSNNTNPYFTSSSLFTINNGGPVVANRWYLIIGVIQPYNDSTTGSDTISGVYDVETGERVAGGGEFKMGNNTTSQVHRAYMYYDESGDAGENVYFWNPGFHAIDGSEPKIQDLVKRQVYLDDGIKAAFGTGNDLQIYHDATDSTILNATGDFKLTCTGDDVVIQAADDVDILVQGGEVSAKFGGNGAVDLYHNNVKKFSTASGGVEVVGEVQGDTLNIDGNADIAGNLTVDGGLITIDQDAAGAAFTWKESDGTTIAGQMRGYANRGDIYLYTDGTKTTEISAISDSFIPALHIGGSGAASGGVLQTTGSVNIDGDADISGTTALGGVTTITNTSTGALTLNGGTGVSTTGAFVLRQNGDAADNGMAITSSNATSHRLWKDASGNFNIGSSANADAFKQDTTGNVTIEGTITSTGQITGTEIEGTSLDINGNADISGTLTVGVDNTGYDVKFFGATASHYMLWDESADLLQVAGDLQIKNANGGNPADAGSLIFNEAGTTWGSDLYGFRLNLEGSSNLLQFQSAHTGTISTILTMGRDNLISTFSGPLTVGVNDTGHDVKFFGATSGSYMLWDESADILEFVNSKINITGNNGSQLSVTAGNAAWDASISLDTSGANGQWQIKAEGSDETFQIVNIDQGGTAPLTIHPTTKAATFAGKVTGTELEGTSLDINGNADISGNLTGLDNVTSTNFIIGGHTIDDVDVAGEFVDSANHLITSAAANDRFAQINANTTGSSGSCTGNAATATLATQATNLNATDDRDMAPEDYAYSDDFRVFFTSKEGLEDGTSTGTNYQDALYINSYSDATGGDANVLAFDKSEKKIYHYQADQAAANWGTAKQLAYTDSDVSGDTTGNAATATTLATARAINGVDFDGSAAITVTAAGSTLSDTVTVAKGGTGLTTVATNTILTGNGTNSLTAEANLSFSTDRLTIGNGGEDIQPFVRFLNDENTLEIGLSNAADDYVTGSADGDVVINSVGDHNVIIGQNDVPALTIDTNGDSNFNRRFTVTGDTDGTYEGDVVYFGGTTSMTVGKIYHYKSDGTWEPADADAASTSDGLLGVALGAASDTNGMLLRGMVTLDHDPGAVGDVLYLSTTQGSATSTAPSGNNDIVRVIGYCLHASNGQIWFNPDSTFVEVTA